MANFSFPDIPDGDLWVFAYGSLMWRPGFRFSDCRPGRLYGYHRALCIWSWVHRGTRQVPGLVLGLDRGGSCRGCVYRVDAREKESVVEYLWERELVTDVYSPRILRIHGTRERLRALTFVVARDHPQYAGRLEPEQAAGVVRKAEGRSGHNTEYLGSTLDHLGQMGVDEPYLQRVWSIMQIGRDTAHSLSARAASSCKPE